MFNTLLPWKFFHAFLLSADFFFQNELFRKILSGIPSECQTDWIQFRPDIFSGLIWVQFVCKGYEQTTQVDKEFKNKLLKMQLIVLSLPQSHEMYRI